MKEKLTAEENLEKVTFRALSLSVRPVTDQKYPPGFLGTWYRLEYTHDC